MRRTELLPDDEGTIACVAAALLPGPLVLIRPYGAELLRRVVRKNSVRYRKDLVRARAYR